MAHCSKEFVLVGYSESLERRPLKFVEPIPAALICSACGIVSRTTFYLVCGHILCEPCYHCCASTSECVCPLDGDVSGKDDVTSKKYQAENLLRRKVHCWNEANGCRAVIPASQIAEHVRHDCQHHVTRCPKCSATLLCRDLCAHLRSQCRALVLRAAPDPPQGTDNRENAQFVAFQGEVQHRVGEIYAKLCQLSLESGSLSDKLVQVCHNNNNLKEALTEELRTASNKTIDRLEAVVKALVEHEEKTEQRVSELNAKLSQQSLEIASQSVKLGEVCHNLANVKEALTQQFDQASDRNLAVVKTPYAEKSQSSGSAETSVLTSVPRDKRTHQREVKGFAAHKETARKCVCSETEEVKVYLGGYLISWNIEFRKQGDDLILCLAFRLHKGDDDEFLEWPFKKALKLSIIHPETGQELHRYSGSSWIDSFKHCLEKPSNDGNTGIRFLKMNFSASELENEGYVKSDQVWLRLEVGR